MTERHDEGRSNERVHSQRRRFLQLAGAGSVAALAGCLADDNGNGNGEGEEGDWEPSQAVRYIVPYDQGGGTDVYARGIVDAFQDAVGEPIQIDNVPGAGGLNGFGDLMGAEPDGHTILGNAGPLEVAPQLLDDPGFDQRDSTGIGVFGESVWTLVVNEEYEGEVEDLDDVIEMHNTGEWDSIGVQEPGSSQDVIVLLYRYQFEEEVGWEWGERVQYTGTGPVAEAVASGEVPCGIGTDAGTQSVVDTGSIYPVTTFVSDGSEVYPDVPSVTDLGYPEIDFVGGLYRGMYGPPELPEDRVEFFTQALEEAVDDERTQEWTEETGNPTFYEGPEEAEARMDESFEEYDELDVIELVEEHS